MKKKLISSITWLVIAAIWMGIWKFIFYKVDMYYSILSAQQLENDSTYGKLQFHPTATTITSVIFFLGILFIIYKIFTILFSKNKVPVK